MHCNSGCNILRWGKFFEKIKKSFQMYSEFENTKNNTVCGIPYRRTHGPNWLLDSEFLIDVCSSNPI